MRDASIIAGTFCPAPIAGDEPWREFILKMLAAFRGGVLSKKASGAVPLQAYFDTTYYFESGPNGAWVTSTPVVLTATGGTPPYTYTWSKTAGTGNAAFGVGSASQVFSSTGTGVTRSSSWWGQITDANTTAAVTTQLLVDMEHTV